MARAASSRTWRVPWRGVLLGPALALLATAATLVMDRAALVAAADAARIAIVGVSAQSLAESSLEVR